VKPALTAHTLDGKKNGQNQDQQLDMTTSRQVPTGSQRETEEFPWEEVGNRADTSVDNGSELIDSHR